MNKHVSVYLLTNATRSCFFLTSVSDFSYCMDGATWLFIPICFPPRSPVVPPLLLPCRRLWWWHEPRCPGSSDLCYYQCANPHRSDYPFTLSFLQSAVTCLQWPMEYIIVFGLAEGKVKEGRQPQERLGGGDNCYAERNMVNLL